MLWTSSGSQMGLTRKFAPAALARGGLFRSGQGPHAEHDLVAKLPGKRPNHSSALGVL